jgi:hypothetical protein
MWAVEEEAGEQTRDTDSPSATATAGFGADSERVNVQFIIM